MKSTLKFTWEGREIELLIELSENAMADLIKKCALAHPKLDPTGLERIEAGQGYWRIDPLMIAEPMTEYNDEDDNAHWDCGNYFSSKEVCENTAKAIQLWLQIRRYAIINDWLVTEEQWKDIEAEKFVIYFHHGRNELDVEVFEHHLVQDYGTVYFNSREGAKEVLHYFYPELTWYFTQREAADEQK